MVSRREGGRWVERVLRFPLAGKLAGANVLIVVVALTTASVLHGSEPRDREVLAVLGIALAVGLAVNLALVTVALRPLRALEATAARVRAGDLDARVAASPLADPDVRRVGDALNLLLDELVADRARIRRLASEVIRAGDAERARLAHELHDSTAQTLSAVVMQLAAAARDSRDEELAMRIASIKAAALDALEEVRLLSITVHPRVLDDLGLPAALNHLARESGRTCGLQIDVDAPPAAPTLPTDRASVLYRVAQEAVANALRHGKPSTVCIRLEVGDRDARLEVTDDGAGFDMDSTARNAPGLGIFSMRERVSLVGGTFELTSRPGAGTRVRASVPIVLTATSPGSAT
jgi:signal transduction histidine kinase